ncbi:SLC13 family permease [Actinomycetospora straminea]|uniref:SLC13 family permease n=1 Tax=Actinomycetospora straminea TaxID=663607 RepID=A0ABP9ER91_9PSEU|nr:SLC13 family permease [Actinomycetospora straminea]MDD7934004.1 SLC13 family permease [Actinomycetospora straminea]
MTPVIVSIVVLVAMFVIATVLPVNLGALGFVAAALVGVLAAGMSLDDVLAEFPGDLFLILVGLTYLFAVAHHNGTVDLLVRWSMRLVRGHLVAAPWIFFTLSAVFSAIGALFAVAIVAPLAMPFARRYGVSLLLMGMMVIHGSLAGAFSPISVYGTFVAGVVGPTGIPFSSTTLFLAPLVINIVIAAVIFVVLGGRSLAGTKVAHGAPVGAGRPSSGGDGAPVTTEDTGSTDATGRTDEEDDDEQVRVGRPQVLTLIGILALAVGTVGFGLDVGVLSLAIAVTLGILCPAGHAEAAKGIAWSTVLLVCGVLTYVGVLQEAGTVDVVGQAIVALGVPLLAALLLCYLGGVLSAFASSAGILGVAIPLALPFLQQGAVSPIGMVAALAVASTVVDVSPFSTNGALVLASTPADVDRDAFYRRMLVYSGIVVATGPLLAWALLVLPGWL